jgi:hypothetical protein
VDLPEGQQDFAFDFFHDAALVLRPPHTVAMMVSGEQSHCVDAGCDGWLITSTPWLPPRAPGDGHRWMF